ncbi:MAG TPA: 16S rRNA (uracil(1498)-N(3))-methyltransferase [Micromonosporaceae bacterium]
MSLALFLVGELPTGDSCTLDGPEGHHAADVQRLRVGERLLLGDGVGGRATAEVTAVGKGTLALSIIDRSYVRPPSPRIVVAQGIPKGDRGELAVQAMTEVGVDGILPWAALRCVSIWRGDRGVKARDKWAATAREASKQARRSFVPTVAPAAVTTAELAPRATFVLHEEATAALSSAPLPTDGDIVLVVGPEGGISDEEVATFTAAGALPVRLGENVLRTSTAGVAATCVLATRLGRW